MLLMLFIGHVSYKQGWNSHNLAQAKGDWGSSACIVMSVGFQKAFKGPRARHRATLINYNWRGLFWRWPWPFLCAVWRLAVILNILSQSFVAFCLLSSIFCILKQFGKHGLFHDTGQIHFLYNQCFIYLN